MDEQITNAQQTATPRKKAAKLALTPKTFTIAAVVLLALAILVDCLPFFTVIFQDLDFADFLYNLSSELAYATRTLLLGLLLPVALFCLKDNDKKSGLSKIFFGAAALALVMQLLAVVVFGFIELLEMFDADLEFLDFLYPLIGWIPGDNLLSSPLYLLSSLDDWFKVLDRSGLFGRDAYVLRQFLSCVCGGTAALLYVLSNVVCTLGFAKMAFTKKK